MPQDKTASTAKINHCFNRFFCMTVLPRDKFMTSYPVCRDLKLAQSPATCLITMAIQTTWYHVGRQYTVVTAHTHTHTLCSTYFSTRSFLCSGFDQSTSAPGVVCSSFSRPHRLSWRPPRSHRPPPPPPPPPPL